MVGGEGGKEVDKRRGRTAGKTDAKMGWETKWKWAEKEEGRKTHAPPSHRFREAAKPG